jgi:sec-independent protein translocase protein TatB
MNFFGVGPAELIVILVVALIFVGPERLPRLAADLARTIREIRKYTGSLAAEFNEVIKDFENETVGDRSQWTEIGEGLTGATRSVTEALRGARADAAGPATAEALAAEITAARNSATGAAPPPDSTIDEAEWREIPEPPAPAADAPAEPDAAPAEGAAETGAALAEIAPTAGREAPVPAAEEPR